MVVVAKSSTFSENSSDLSFRLNIYIYMCMYVLYPSVVNIMYIYPYFFRSFTTHSLLIMLVNFNVYTCIYISPLIT